MARCESNDGKFAGLEEPEVEVESEEVADGELQASVRVFRACSGCGQEQATLALEFAISFEHVCPDEDEECASCGWRPADDPYEHPDVCVICRHADDHDGGCKACDPSEKDHPYEHCISELPTRDYDEALDDRTYSVDGSVEAEPVDEYARTDRRGKPIKNPRYQKHMLGAAVSASITCSRCGDTFDVSETQTEPASAFEDEGAH
jgi:hypothetical protein